MICHSRGNLSWQIPHSFLGAGKQEEELLPVPSPSHPQHLRETEREKERGKNTEKDVIQ